jgi:glycosyltransferase involved in cell wall biosynthesis
MEQAGAWPGASSADTAVVIPVYNGARFLAEALGSLQRQSLQDWVAVIVDDGSSDDSFRLAQQHTAADPRFLVVTQPNAGPAGARRSGLDRLPATVSYVAFLDADDRYETTALAQLRDRLAARPDAVGAYALARYIDPLGAPVLGGRHEAVQQDRRTLVGRRIVDGDPNSDLGFESLVVSSPIWPAAVALLRVGAVLAVGGPDATFRVQEDWELYLRLSRLGPFLPVSDVLVDYRRHEDNATAVSDDHSHAQDRLRRKAWVSPDNTRLQRQTAARAWRWLLVREAREHAHALGQAARRRDPRTARHSAGGVLLCLSGALLPGPPRMSAGMSGRLHALPYVRHPWHD